jgi:hypothetical protein
MKGGREGGREGEWEAGQVRGVWVWAKVAPWALLFSIFSWIALTVLLQQFQAKIRATS